MKKYQESFFYDFLFKKTIFGQNPAGGKEFYRSSPLNMLKEDQFYALPPTRPFMKLPEEIRY
jgi:hypothetical protein